MSPELFLERIAAHYKQRLPFVVYRKPSSILVKANLVSDSTLHHVVDYSESGFIFAPFKTDQAPILFPTNLSEHISSEIVSEPNVSFKENLSDELSAGKEFHMSIVSKAIQKIEKDLLSKVVLSRAETIPLGNDDVIKLFHRLLNYYPEAFVYCWFHPEIGLWVGATPETLIQIEGSRFKTMSLAGTQKYEGLLDVRWEEKELEEQRIVTDYLVDRLSDSVKDLRFSNVETIKAGTLLHLRTQITGTMISSLENVIQLLHPTPAVCGYPVEEAKSFILEQENYDREFYTGYLGELNVKEKVSRNKHHRNIENNAYAAVRTKSNLFVNLRCMKIRDQEAKIFVGGGITKDSNPELEWEETVSKSKTMKRVVVF